MTKKQLEKLLNANDYSKVVQAISIPLKQPQTKYSNTVSKALTPLEEANVEDHPIFDRSYRKDKVVEGSTEDKKVNRIGIAAEAYIASRAAAFLCGNPIKQIATPKEKSVEEKMLEAFKRVEENNKLGFKNQGILETRMTELQSLEIWYFQKLEEGDDYWAGTGVKSQYAPRLFLASPSLGDEIFPVWDNDRLIAGGRQWTEKVLNGTDIVHFDIFLKGEVIELVQQGSTWVQKTDLEPSANEEIEAESDNEAVPELNKLQIIYHFQPEAEHAKVRAIIRRLENIYSNFADSNDRFAFPWLLVRGKVKSIPQGVADKIMEVNDGAEAEFLAPPNAKDSIELEIEQLWRELHRLTDTVDITNDSLNALGQTTGPALEFRFLPAHLKASKHAGTFGETIQRRNNLIMAMIAACDETLKEGLTLQIKPQFDYFLPKDLAGIVNYLSTATTSGVLSQETAVAQLQSAMGGDGKAEFERVTAEKEAEQERQDDLKNALNDAA